LKGTLMAANLTFENAPRARSVYPVSTAPGRASTGLVASVRAVLGRWRQLAATREQLSRLSERTLRDIGFDPEQARLEAEKPFWKPYTLTPSSQR
jgi:uncharacterized protein YjiS (DUF1127 family)